MQGRNEKNSCLRENAHLNLRYVFSVQYSSFRLEAKETPPAYNDTGAVRKKGTYSVEFYLARHLCGQST